MTAGVCSAHDIGKACRSAGAPGEDALVYSCQGWCDPAEEAHCQMCKCRGCSFCPMFPPSPPPPPSAPPPPPSPPSPPHPPPPPSSPRACAMGVKAVPSSDYMGKGFKMTVDIATWMESITLLFNFQGEIVQCLLCFSLTVQV